MPFRHVLYDVWVQEPEILERTGPIEEIMLEAARRTGATILRSYFHQFDPHGVTGIVLIAQSHLSIHTWSEDGYAAIDLFAYSHMDPDAAIAYIRERFRPVREKVTDLSRGGMVSAQATS
ncbi:MAG: adenosylmethionine decarboxylase [Chloroflexota bacterium]|nr:adenosylmethionine decarboxylase [Chloroflexota bacterium]